MPNGSGATIARIPYLVVVAFYGSCLVLLLMFIHYIQPLAKEATRLSVGKQPRDFPGRGFLPNRQLHHERPALDASCRLAMVGGRV